MGHLRETREQWKRRMGVGEPQRRFGRHVGKPKAEVVHREDNGKIGGIQTYHWDGRVDAKVFADTSAIGTTQEAKA